MNIKFKEFMDGYDNWNGITRVNNNELETIIEDETLSIMENREDLFDREVVSFGFYDNVLCVRVK